MARTTRIQFTNQKWIAIIDLLEEFGFSTKNALAVEAANQIKTAVNKSANDEVRSYKASSQHNSLLDGLGVASLGKGEILFNMLKQGNPLTMDQHMELQEYLNVSNQYTPEIEKLWEKEYGRLLDVFKADYQANQKKLGGEN